MTREEAEEQVKAAKEKGATKAATTPSTKEASSKKAAVPTEGETKNALNKKADQADSKRGGGGAAGKGQGEAKDGVGGEMGPPTDDSALPRFADEADGGRLAQYAAERAWHDEWTGSPESSSMTTEDRAALVGEAILAGGVSGLTNAAVAIVTDQLINRATKSVPYASGFIALGQLAYDPKAWVDSSFVAPGKNIAEGGSKVWAAITGKGDVIDGLEGVVDILEGINSLIGTISTICMIVAAVLGLSGFVLAIFGVGAALLAAAAMCMKAGVFLGKISTIAGIIISALRVILIAARAIQIMVSDADPETQAQRAASLQTQTQKLTQESAQRYANKRLNDAGKKAAKDREGSAKKADSTTKSAKPQDTGAKETVSQTEDKRWRVTKALDALSFGGFSGNRKEARETWNKDSIEFAPKSHQKVLKSKKGAVEGADQAVAKETAAQQARDAAKARAKAAQTARAPDEAAEQRHKAAQQKLIQADNELVAARERNLGAMRAEHQARAKRDSAKAAYEAAKGSSSIPAEEVQSLKASYEKSRESYITTMQERTAGPFKDHLRTDKARELAAADADRAQGALPPPKDAARRSAAYDDAMREMARRQADLARADADADEAQRLLIGGNATKKALKENSLFRSFVPGARATGRDLKDTFGSWQGFVAGGTEPENQVYGHQNTAGSTGVGTGIFMKALGDKAGPGVTGVLGIGGSGDRTEKEKAEWATQMRENVEEARFGHALPAPPDKGLEGEVDAAAERYAELDLEERRVKAQTKEVTALHTSTSDEMAALHGVQALTDANQKAIDGEQQELDKKEASQKQLKDKATGLGDQADQADQKHQSESGPMGDFMNKFMSLMGMVPSALVSNPGEGSGSAQKLGDGFGKGGDGAKDGQAMSKGALKHADELGAKTTETRSSFKESTSDLQGLKALTTTETEETMAGQELLAQSAARSQKKLKEIADKKQEERQRHESAIAAMAGWAEAHHDARTDGQQALESQLDEAEAGIEEHGGTSGAGGGGGGAGTLDPADVGAP